MNKIFNIFNPYSLLVLGVFIEYFPSFYGDVKPSIQIGSISLYITDISVIFLGAYAAVSFLTGKSSSSSMRGSTGRKIQIMLGLFFIMSCVKWLIQSDHDISSIRMMVSFSSGYLFLYFLPTHVTREKILANLLTLLVIFQVYIFILHIYAFATQGFKQHILSGGFLTVLSFLYFLVVINNNLLKLPSVVSFAIKALVITTFLIVGHRSAFIGLMLGLVALTFFSKKQALKEITGIVVVIIAGAGLALSVSPNLLKKVSDRAATTFDAEQDTYQGRYLNMFSVLTVSMENPLIGKPLVTTESRDKKKMWVEKGNVTTSTMQSVITPHNLLLEWLYYYGFIGLALGMSMLIIAIRFVKRFLRKHKNNILCYRIGVVVLCTMVHNLFFALTNVTAMSVFSTFFLYLPLMVLIAVSNNEESYCKTASGK